VEERQDRPVTVYVSARVYDPEKKRVYRRGRRRGRRKGGAMRHVWSIRLERWTPAEVHAEIVRHFQSLADKEAATKETVNGQK